LPGRRVLVLPRWLPSDLTVWYERDGDRVGRHLVAHNPGKGDPTMSAIEIGRKLVALCNADKNMEAVESLYAKNVVSIEGQGSEEMPARMEGIDAIRGKHTWWYDNHEVHSATATGPFCGHRDDQFVVKFDMDITPKGGARMQMSEIALYTVKDGKVAQEEFLYLMP
jgi:hypothetical protein